MLSEGDKSFGDSIASDEGILGDDGGIMGLSGGDSIMGSVGDSIMGEESIYGLGASSKLAEVAIQVMDGGKPVVGKAFNWKLKVSTMQGSAEQFTQSADGMGKTDANGVLRMPLAYVSPHWYSSSTYDTAAFAPFPVLVTVASADDPKTVILSDRPIMASVPPAAPVTVTMTEGGGLAPYIPPGGDYSSQAGMLEGLLPYVLVAGGAALVWFYVIPWAKKKLA
jgi:hypothetical protein